MQIIDPYGQGGGVELGDDLGYIYPFGLKGLKPGEELHSRILQEVNHRAKDSKSVMETRYDSWQKSDQIMTAFTTMDEAFNQNLGKNKEISVIVPMGFAIIDTLLSHLLSIYMGGVYMPQKGIGPEDSKAAMLAELVLDLQFHKSDMLLNFYTQYRDMYMYGLGVVSPTWQRHWGKKITVRDTGKFSPELGEMVESGVLERRIEHGIVWEGNELENWNPYSYLPDPNRPVHQVQKGQFVGNVSRMDYYELLTLEETEPETYFNVRYLDGKGDMKSQFSESGEWTDILRDSDQGGTSCRIDVLNMYCKIIPKKWGLGKSEYPQIWLFSIAGDCYVIRCQPVTFAHNEYPVCVACPTFDGYSSSPMGILEMIHPMLDMLNWYCKSHFHNVRKNLNNMFLIDPFLVNYSHAANPEPGKLICMREHVWGRGVKDAMMQLQTTDVTQNNVADMGMTIDIMERITGAVSQMQGITQTRGERRSATESRDTRVSALGRVATQAILASVQSNKRVSRQCIFNIQQFMENPMFVELTGRNQLELHHEFKDTMTKGVSANSLLITPDMLIGDYDIVPLDNIGDSGEYLAENIQLNGMIYSNPELLQAFDSTKMMLHMLRMSGMKHPTQMLRSEWRLQMIPDEQVLEAAASGQIVPLGSGEGQTPAQVSAPKMAGPGQKLSGRFSDVLERATNG